MSAQTKHSTGLLLINFDLRFCNFSVCMRDCHLQSDHRVISLYYSIYQRPSFMEACYFKVRYGCLLEFLIFIDKETEAQKMNDFPKVPKVILITKDSQPVNIHFTQGSHRTTLGHEE